MAGSGTHLQDGELVRYMATLDQPPIITGTIVLRPDSICGIRCHHCNEVISASQVIAALQPTLPEVQEWHCTAHAFSFGMHV